MPDKLIVLKGERKGAEFPLSDSLIVIGSDPECDIRLPEKGVLGKHAAMDKKKGEWLLHAFDGTHPIGLKGKDIQELKVSHGVVFSVGEAHLRFVSEGHAESGERSTDDSLQEIRQAQEKIMAEMDKVIVGQKEVLSQIMVSLFARGHCILIGVPGLAKTLMVKTLSSALDLDFKRIQFTPDLMPSDITGTNVLEEDISTRTRKFRFNKGPIFAHVLLADEINRTPPKTQAALLEAMQEQRVTSSGVTYELPQPFLVLATQNPIEQEGTYPLPEAQLDRFMFCVHVPYPDPQEEEDILLSTTRDLAPEVKKVLDANRIVQLQHLVRQVPVSKHVASYAASLVRATRPGTKEAPEFISRWVTWGAGPRAGQYLLLAAKAHVLLSGRKSASVSCVDIRKFALPVLRHRIFCNFVAASEGITSDEVITRLIKEVKEK